MSPDVERHLNADTAAKKALIERLPVDARRNVIFTTEETAVFLGLSVPRLRTLYREKLIPQPIRIGLRNYGWRLGDLQDFVEQRAKQAA